MPGKLMVTQPTIRLKTRGPTSKRIGMDMPTSKQKQKMPASKSLTLGILHFLVKISLKKKKTLPGKEMNCKHADVREAEMPAATLP